MLDMSSGEADLMLRATFALLALHSSPTGTSRSSAASRPPDVETNGRMVGTVLGTGAAIVGLQLGWGIWALPRRRRGHRPGRPHGAGDRNPAGRSRRAVPVALVPGHRVEEPAGLLSFALLSQLSDVVDSQWDKIVLSRYVGSSVVASFQLGTTLALQAKALALLPVAPLLVAVAELHRRDPQLVSRLLRVLSSATFALGALTLSGVVVFAPTFLRLWINEDLPQAVVSARMFSVAIALNLVAAPLAYRALAEGKHRLAADRVRVQHRSQRIASYVLTLVVGFRGPLWGSIVGNVCGTLVFFTLMSRVIERDIFTHAWRSVVIGVLAAAIAIGVGADDIRTWPVLVTAVLVFSATVGSLLCWAEKLPVRELLRRDLAAIR